MNRKSAFFWLIYISVLFLLIIVQRMERIKSGYNLARQNTLITDKKARNDYFEIVLLQTKSPRNLISQSKKRLNLNIPEPDRIFVLNDIETEKTLVKYDTLIAKFLHRL